MKLDIHFAIQYIANCITKLKFQLAQIEAT